MLHEIETLGLPEGYVLDVSDPDVIALVSPRRKVIARFASGADPREVELAAYRDSSDVQGQILDLQDALLARRENGKRRVGIK